MTAKFIQHPNRVVGKESLFRFRRTYTLKRPKEAKLKILADSRYKLWVNGYFIAAGPCKGSRHVRYYDEVNISTFLKDGDNLFFVEVVNLPLQDGIEGDYNNLASVLRYPEMYLYIDGYALDGNGTQAIVTDSTWESVEETHVTFTQQFFVGMNEHTTPGFGKNTGWTPARELDTPCLVEGDTAPFGQILSTWAKPRTIPQMTYIPHQFKFHDGYYDAGRLMTGYIRFTAKGKGKITVRYGECFVEGDDTHFKKGDRADVTGHLLGHEDTFQINGPFQFESFWFRTFRFVKVTCEGSAEVTDISYAETGYPLAVSSKYDFGNATDNALWDISLRTLRRCMQETYVDCPYYEQLQYCMDTYSEMLYTYMISDDLRLPRRAIEDFAMTWYPGGLTEARAPSCKRQYIPGFSLFFVDMLNMYEARTGDSDYIKPFMPVVDGVLAWFDSHRNEKGQVAVSGMWDFVDWAGPWKATEGAPITERGEGITVYSMMYAWALSKAARLQRVLGRGSVAEEYLTRREDVLNAVKEHCYDDLRHFFADSEKKRRFSQHAQIWAVLSGLVRGQEAKDLLARSTALDAQGGYAYAYLWFRSLEMAGCYELAKDRMDEFRGLLDKNCTTIPETPFDDSRSECHAWGAVALFEFTSMVLGVKLRDDLSRMILVSPYVEGRDRANGRVFTRFGVVEVSWKKEGNAFTIDVTAPDTAPVEIAVPRGFYTYSVTLNGKEIPPVYQN